MPTLMRRQIWKFNINNIYTLFTQHVCDHTYTQKDTYIMEYKDLYMVRGLYCVPTHNIILTIIF